MYVGFLMHLAKSQVKVNEYVQSNLGLFKPVARLCVGGGGGGGGGCKAGYKWIQPVVQPG